MEPIADGAVDKREEIKNKLRQCNRPEGSDEEDQGRRKCAGLCPGVSSWAVL